VLPLGACCIASAAEAAGNDVRFLDLTFRPHPEAAVSEDIKCFEPDVIGISVRNLDNCDYLHPHSYLPEIRKIVEACRSASRAVIVAGGAAVGLASEMIAGYLGCDLAVAGEGETAFPLLLEEIAAGRTVDKIREERQAYTAYKHRRS